jgi:hypothetical protein
MLGMLVELGIVGMLMLPPISPPYEGVDEGIDAVDAGAWTAVMLVELLVLLVLFVPVKLPAPVICGIFTGRSAGICTGTFLETVCSDISCIPPFLRDKAREGDPVSPKFPEKSMETASSVLSIRSRLLKEDVVPLVGSRLVMSSCNVPGLRLPRVLMLNAPRDGSREILIFPEGSITSPFRMIL